MRKTTWIALASLAFAMAAKSSLAVPSYYTFPTNISWRTQSSPHFHSLFRAGSESVSALVLQIAEGVHSSLSPIFPKGPEKTWIVLADFQDSANGYALDLPWPHMVLFLSPPDAASQLSGMDDWLSTLVLHEYVHILQLYPVRSFWTPMRAVFGSWVLPNGLVPSHFHEGIATFLETQLTTGGRGRGPHFSMMRRMAVEEKHWNLDGAPFDLFDGCESVWPHGTSAYFFGYHFFEELWKRKGEKGIYELTENYAGNIPYLVNAPLRNTYDADVNAIWASIFENTQKETEKEIAAIKAQPLSVTEKITESQFSKGSLTASPDGKEVLFFSHSPQEGGKWYLFDVATKKIGKEIDLGDVGGTGLCWVKREGADHLVYLKPTHSDRYSLNHLAAFDMKSSSSWNLRIAGEPPLNHFHTLGCSSDGKRIVAYFENTTQGDLVEYAWSSDKKTDLTLTRRWKLPKGTWITSILVDDVPLFTLRQSRQTSFYEWRGEAPSRISGINSHVYALARAPTPGEYFAISDVEGRNEIWRFAPKSRKTTKVVALLGGANSYAPLDKGFLVSSYHYGGYDLETAQQVTNGKSVAMSDQSPQDLLAERTVAGVELTQAENYSPLSTILPSGWIPMSFLVPGGFEMGAWIPGFDISQRHIYDIFLGYNTLGFPFGDIGYVYRITNPVSLSAKSYYLPTYFYGDNATQIRWGGKLSLSGKFPGWDPSFEMGLVFRKTSAFLRYAENTAVGVSFSVNYQFGFQSAPNDVTPSRGTRLGVEHVQYFAEMGSTYPFFSTIGSVDQYLGAPWGHGQGFYAGLKASLTEGASNANLYNSYFLGGGELLFAQGRGFFLNRGYWPQTFFAQRIVNLNLEYRFPILRVDRGWWLWPAFLESISGAVVTDATTYDWGKMKPVNPAALPAFYPSIHPSVGLELKSQWTFGYYMPTQVRVGIYHGFPPLGEILYATMGVTASL